MTYYEQLIKHMDKSMKAHPRSTVVMDSDSFKVVASGRDTKKLTRKLKRAKARDGISVVFQQPAENAVWVLPSRIAA